MSDDQHDDQHDDAYDGAVTLTAGDAVVETTATLRGHFEPIDGRFHWYGRLAASDDVATLGSGVAVTLTTAHGAASGRLSDVDPWGRLRIAGVGRPPF